MKLLPGSVGIRRTDDVHGKFQEAMNGHEMHVEGGFRRRVGTRRLDRLVLLGGMLDRPIKFRGADLDESLEIVA